MINIELNGEKYVSEAKNIEALILELEMNQMVVATAKNGEFIPQEQREEASIKPGDKIEILSPMQGG